MAVFFVYTPGIRGPEPQLWKQKPTNGAGVAKPTLQSEELTDAFSELTLDQLSKLYPYKGFPNVT
jgi:hypothetical protein